MADAKTEKQKVKEITDKLEEGLKELFDSEKYRSYLSTMSKFHNYSVNNTLLIAMQKPEASLVAGFRAWQKNFNRHVNKGEKGIRILAPTPYIIKEERDKLDPVTGEVMLDKEGMPQTEEVEVKIPAFRAVSVFDVSQTDGEPIPELEAKELLSTVEGYEDFIKAVTYVAPATISFEDIPGSSRGFFSPTENRIAVQEGMSESQTLKTMVHETAHSMLHSKEVDSDILVPVKDRNTKEVEAESIAFTVCSHFGIDTSEYSFGYIAGWSSGRDMKELKSSLDTIRKTASELIMGIEGQLIELQRDREIMQEQEKESLLLIQNSDLSEYSLVSVRGMEADEVVEALYAMNGDDRLSVAAYLESRGAWVTEIANEGTKEFGEYHLDVRYNTDTNEVTDLKAEMEWNERAKEPIGADDVILKITHAEGFEVERITNKTPEEVQEIMTAIIKLENKDRKSIHDCLESYGADYIPIIVSDGRNSGMPQFNDFEMDLNKKNITMMHHLSPAKQVEGFINRLEFAKTAFSDDERNLIVNYAFKLNNMEKTRELAEHIYYEETEGNQGAALAVIDAQAEIDALPDTMIGLWEMEEYGYTWKEMLPLTKETALELFDHDLPVYQLHEDGSETLINEKEQITEHEGIFGIEKKDWENERDFREMQRELAENAPEKEAQLLYGDTDKYGIYQLKDSPELRDFHFAGTAELLRRKLLSDDYKEIQPENYNLIYTGELSDIKEQEQRGKLNAIFEKFNIDHPADYRGHSLSVSDIVVLHENGKNSTHFVDSYGFTELLHFTRALEGVKEQDMEKAEPEETKDTSGHDVQKPEAGQKPYPDFYGHTLRYAADHGQVDEYHESHKFDRECKEAVEETIRQNFDGMHLNHDIVKPLAERYGSERMAFILANTIQQESWDGRFSRDNKAWASEFPISENIVHGIDMNRELIVSSHPAVLDGFIDMFRREVLEQEKEISAVQEKDTSGHDVQKPETGQTEKEQAQMEKPEKLQPKQDEPEKPPKTMELADMEDEDEIIDLGDERDEVLAEMKQSLKGEQETEHEQAEESMRPGQEEPDNDIFTYYVIEDLSARVGSSPEKGEVERFDNLAEAIARFKECRGREDVDQTDTTKAVFGFGINGKEFDVLHVKNNWNCVPLEFTQEEVENSRFKSDLQSLYQEVGFDRAEIFRERLPEETKELVKELYELQLKFSGIKDVSLYMDKFDILYEQGEMENLIPKGEQNRILENIPFTEWKNPYIDTNVEEADKTEPQKNVVEEFKAKTDELFHEISEMNPSEIEETIKRHVQAKIDESGIAAEIVDVAVVGSRCRGLEGESSDLDVVVELSTNEREDVLFDTLNEGGLHIGGIQVDINPITAQRAGTLETYLPKVEEYLDGVREAREHEQVKEAVHREQTQAEVTLTVAECGEFHNLGEFYENIPMVDEAIAIWKQIPPERMNGIPAIGISIHRPGDEPYQDTEMDILSGRRIDLEILDYIPEIKNNPQAMEVIAQLAAKLPDMEIDGKMSEEMEARVWKIRMPDLTPAEQLAVLFDRFVYDYDRNQYHDSIQSMTENVADGAEAIEKGDTGYMTEWLASVIAEGAEPEETKKAAELLEKLSEYKPLAKIEEVEESNFNMIDNMLNNGAGEKAQKEENRREQERPAARTSLKARLAEKKALVSDQGKDNEAKENEKKKQREM